MKTAKQSTGRQVLDRNYYLNELRHRRQELLSVVEQMQDEMDAIEKKSQTFALMDSRHSQLSKEVKTLQDQLADFNMVLEKVGSRTPTASIQEEYNALKRKNESQRKRVDESITERMAVESKTKQVEAKLLELQASLDSKISSMAPSQRKQYLELQGEQQTLLAEVARGEDLLNELDRSLASAEGQLERNPMKKRVLEVQEQIKGLMERKYQLQKEDEQSNLSPEEQKAQLMDKIKRDNQDIEAATKEAQEMQANVKRLEAKLAAVSGGAGQSADDASRREKFEELLNKERELTDFMDSFPDTRAKKLEEKRYKEDSLSSIKERITKLSSVLNSNLPSQQTFQDMQDELEYKKLHLENTQVTQDRLKEELAMRQSELSKIDILEEKIGQELEQLTAKSKDLNSKLEKYSQVEETKARAEEKRVRLEAQKERLLGPKEYLRVAVAEKGWKYQAKKAQLQENNVQIALDKLDQKLRMVQQNVFTMSDFIKAKQSETNYEPLKTQISSLVEALCTSVVQSYAS